MLCLADWVLRYTRHFFGPSSYSLRVAVGHLAPPNECSANHMAEITIIFVSLSCGGYFPLNFPVVFTVSVIMNRLKYIIESCQSFATVLFSGLRNISLQILRIVGRVWNEGSRMLIVNGYHPHRLLQGLWSYKISPLWGCLHSSGLFLFEYFPTQ